MVLGVAAIHLSCSAELAVEKPVAVGAHWALGRKDPPIPLFFERNLLPPAAWQLAHPVGGPEGNRYQGSHVGA